jgi:hypothetical protein
MIPIVFSFGFPIEWPVRNTLTGLYRSIAVLPRLIGPRGPVRVRRWITRLAVPILNNAAM